MKMLFALLFLILACPVLADEAKPNLDDPATRNKILAQAIDIDKLQARNKEGENLCYAPNSQTPHTGWVKVTYDNGEVMHLYQYKDGKEHGLSTGWYEDGQKWHETNYKDGERQGLERRWYMGEKHELEWHNGELHGLWIKWDKDGKVTSETMYENGELVEKIK